MLKRLVTTAFLATATVSAYGQVNTIIFQDGVTELPGGGFYNGTVDTEFRAANSTTPQGDNAGISIDDFDGGFQTQAAMRFEDILISEGGLIASGADVVFATLQYWVTSPTAQDAIINHNRVVSVDTETGAVWGNDDTWASLGGDLIPDAGGFLDGDPILEDGTEAASTPDAVVGGAGALGDPSVYAPQRESQNVMGDLLAGIAEPTEEQILNAVQESFYSFDVTATVQDWVNGAPNYGWSINNNTSNGWDLFSSELSGIVGTDDATSEITENSDPTVKINNNTAGELVEARLLRPRLIVGIQEGDTCDLNGDGACDNADYQLILDNLAIELDEVIQIGSTGDLDFDRDVDLDDFSIFKTSFNEVNGPGAFALMVAVPEPTTVALVLVGGLAVGVSRRG